MLSALSALPTPPGIKRVMLMNGRLPKATDVRYEFGPRGGIIKVTRSPGGTQRRYYLKKSAVETCATAPGRFREDAALRDFCAGVSMAPPKTHARPGARPYGRARPPPGVRLPTAPPRRSWTVGSATDMKALIRRAVGGISQSGPHTSRRRTLHQAAGPPPDPEADIARAVQGMMRTRTTTV